MANSGIRNDLRFDNITVTGSITIGGVTIPEPGLNSISGVSNAGGDVDIVGGTGITVTPDDVANTVTISAMSGVCGLTREALTVSSSPTNLDQSVCLSELSLTTPGITGTLPNGTELGQLKYIVICDVSGGGTYACTTATGSGGNYTMEFDTVNQSIILVWTSTGWCRTGGTGATIT